MSDPGAPPPPGDGGGDGGFGGGGWQAPPPPPPPPPPYASAPPPPAYGQPTAYGQPPAYGVPQYGYAPAPQTEGTAIGALIASIVAWVFCPVVPAIVALVLIPGARRKIGESGGRLTGEGFLTAAKWVSWINIGFYGLLAVLLVVLIIIGVLADSTSTTSDFSLGAVLRA